MIQTTLYTIHARSLLEGMARSITPPVKATVPFPLIELFKLGVCDDNDAATVLAPPPKPAKIIAPIPPDGLGPALPVANTKFSVFDPTTSTEDPSETRVPSIVAAELPGVSMVPAITTLLAPMETRAPAMVVNEGGAVVAGAACLSRVNVRRVSLRRARGKFATLRTALVAESPTVGCEPPELAGVASGDLAPVSVGKRYIDVDGDAATTCGSACTGVGDGTTAISGDKALDS